MVGKETNRITKKIHRYSGDKRSGKTLVYQMVSEGAGDWRWNKPGRKLEAFCLEMTCGVGLFFLGGCQVVKQGFFVGKRAFYYCCRILEK